VEGRDTDCQGSLRMGKPNVKGESKNMKIVEIFESLQGEGRYMGTQVTFVRLAGCNLGCKWCDTNYTKYTNKTPQEVAETIMSFRSGTVVFTGGEPMLQWKDIKNVIRRLEDMAAENEFHLETNGTLFFSDIKNYIKQVTVSPKLPSAGVKYKAKLPLWLHIGADIKFVIASKQDLEFASSIAERVYPYPILVQPEGGKSFKVFKDDFKKGVLPLNLVILPQLHKIWKLK